MKNRFAYIVLTLLLLSCSKKEVEINYNITINESFSFSKETFSINNNELVDDKNENIKKYFTNYASHLGNDSTYIFKYDGIQNSKDIHITVSYDSQKEEKPYLIACKWYLNEREKYPSAYYFYSAYCEILDFKMIAHNPYYYYETSKNSNEAYVEINYTEIVFSETKIDSATFSLGKGTSMPSRGTKETQDLGNEAITTVNALYSYLTNLLNTIDKTINL